MKKIFAAVLGVLLFTGCMENTQQKKVETQNENKTEVNTTSVQQDIPEDTLSAEFYIHRAGVYLSEEKIGLAMRDMNKALSIDRKNIDAHLLLADLYYALGDEDNIMLTLNKACEYAPLDPRPVVKLSELAFLQGNAQLANAYIDKALELDRYNPRAYYMRGLIAISAQDTAAALKNFMTARIQDEKFVEPKLQIASIYAAKEDTLAKSFYEEAMSVSDGDYPLYYDYAIYLQDNGYPEKAMECYDSLLKVFPDNPMFIYNKGYVNLVYFGDNEEALNCFEQVLLQEPDNVNALFNKGRTYEQMGDFINAKSIYLQILRNNPDYQLAIDAINRIGE